MKNKKIPEFVCNKDTKKFLLKQVKSKSGKKFFESQTSEDKLHMLKDLAAISKNKNSSEKEKSIAKLLYCYILLDLEKRISEREEFFKKIYNI